MPRVNRRRTISAPPPRVWDLVSDPHSLPRWWPRTTRVEDVEGEPGAEGCQWTTVLETAEGRGVRADYRCTAATAPQRYAWEQQLAGTPFERHLRGAGLAIALAPDGEGTEVTLSATQRLRGLSRLGLPLMRRAQGALLDEALEGIERALA